VVVSNEIIAEMVSELAVQTRWLMCLVSFELLQGFRFKALELFRKIFYQEMTQRSMLDFKSRTCQSEPNCFV